MTIQKEMDNKFHSSDAWIFLSIAHGQSKVGVSLEGLISTADCINHAIPTDREIEDAINRLVAAGFVAIENERFKLTNSAEKLFKRIYKKTKSLLKQWQLLEKFLQGIELQKLSSTWTLSRSQAETAYLKYIEKVKNQGQ